MFNIIKVAMCLNKETAHMATGIIVENGIVTDIDITNIITEKKVFNEKSAWENNYPWNIVDNGIVTDIDIYL